MVEGGWTAVPWAWVREGSGGAATRWCWTGIGCLVSRFTALADSFWIEVCDWCCDCD